MKKQTKYKHIFNFNFYFHLYCKKIKEDTMAQNIVVINYYYAHYRLISRKFLQHLEIMYAMGCFEFV